MKLTAHKEGTTKDIMYSLVSAGPAAVNQYLGFPDHIKFYPEPGTNLEEIGKDACRYIKSLVKYKIDPFGVQNIQLPARLIETGKGDCKSLSLFLYAILTSLGYQGGFRFGRYRQNGNFTHVYNYFLDEKNNLLTFDACTSDFEEIKPLENYDMEINYIAEAPVIKRRPGQKGRKKIIVQSRKPRLVDLLQDDRVFNPEPVSGIGKRKGKKWKDKLKNIVQKAKDAGRGLVDKVGKGVKTVALAPARGPFLVLVNVNFRGLAKRLSKLQAKNPAKLREFWLKVGGDDKALLEAINKGKGKKPFLGAKKGVRGLDLIDNTGIGDIYTDSDGIGVDPATITAALTAASGLIIAANKLLGKEKIEEEPGDGNLTADIPDAGGITEPGTDFVAVDPATEEAAQYAVTREIPPTGKTAGNVSTGGFRPSPALLIGGAAAVGLVLYLTKKKK